MNYSQKQEIVEKFFFKKKEKRKKKEITLRNSMSVHVTNILS